MRRGVKGLKILRGVGKQQRKREEGNEVDLGRAWLGTTASMDQRVRERRKGSLVSNNHTRAHLSAVAHPTLYPIASNLARTASWFGSRSSSVGLTAASSEFDKRRAAICCWMALRWSC